MLVFLTLALAGFVLLVFGWIFGHDHDFGHDFSHDFGHDMGHDVDQEGTISIFSLRVLATFVMGFGAAGFVCVWKYKTNNLAASIAGSGFGFAIATLMYSFMRILTKQQGTSSFPLSSLVGSEGIMIVAIDPDETGQVGITFKGQYDTYLAVAKSGKAIHKGKSVRVVAVSGNELVVEEN